ncbi:hypothetical protein BN1723_017353, partial [Verticillium longisporum]
MCLTILFTSGFSVFTKGNWDTAGFISSYLDIPLVTGAYLLWKVLKKTRFVSLDSVPLDSAFEQVDLNPEEPEVEEKGWIRAVSWIWN